MAKTDFKSVDDYLTTLPVEARDVLEIVRAEIRKALPLAVEGISYQIPTYKLGGKAVIHFAGWKEHWSLYPVGDRFAEAFPLEAKGYKLAKGTIRIPWTSGVPADLVRLVVEFRLAEMARPA